LQTDTDVDAHELGDMYVHVELDADIRRAQFHTPPV
jgi:hypothetical protein